MGARTPLERSAQLDLLLRPRSVAVVGASPRQGSWGHTTIANLRQIGFTGSVLPVNPRWADVDGLACYPSIDDLPESPDVAVVAVPAASVPGTIDAAIRRGIPSAVVYASGFGAAGQGEGGATAGTGPKAQLRDLTRVRQIAVLGPNCLGLANYAARSALWGITMPFAHAGTESGVALIAQSGNIALTLSGINRGFALTHLVSCGNQLGVTAAELVGACLRDPAVRVVAAVLEGIPDIAAFRQVAADAAERDIPLIVLKIGRSPKGRAATVAHTGTLSGEPALYRALFRQYGIIQVDDIDELASAAALLSARPRVRASGVAFLASSGGECGLISDLSHALGVPVPDLPPDVAGRIAKLLPDFARISNPLDFTAGGWGDAELYKQLIGELKPVAEIDTIIGVHDAPTLEGNDLDPYWAPIIDGLAAGAHAVAGAGKTVANMTSVSDVRSPIPGALAAAGVVPLAGLRPSLSALARISQRSRWSDARATAGTRPARPGQGGVVAAAVPAMLDGHGDGAMTESEAKDVLARCGIRSPRREVAGTAEDAIAAAGRLGYPVVVKVSSAAITHKTDADGVAVGLADAAAVASAATRLLRLAASAEPAAAAEVLVEEMVPPGLELIAGAYRDESFGPVVMVGLGGTVTEILNDVSHRVAPLTPADAVSMIDDLSGSRLLDGYRGSPPADRAALAEILLALSELVLADDRIAEIDVNPLRWEARAGQFVALDALLVLRHGETDQAGG
jgi:acetyltransferase